jgi:acyl-CoA thioester hydrolase
MPRIEIDFPERVCFVQHAQIRIGDLSASGHLGADRLVSIIDDASASFFKSHGIERGTRRPVGVIYADLQVSYRSQAFHGDDITVEIAAGDVSAKGLELFFRVTRSQTGRVVAMAKIDILFYNYQTRRLIEVPEGLRSL